MPGSFVSESLIGRLGEPLICLALLTLPFGETTPARGDDSATIRVATFNVSMYRQRQGQLAADLRQGDPQARQIAEVLQLVRPDIVLLNEFDFDTSESVAIFCRNYLEVSQAGCAPLEYGASFRGPVNTGLMSRFDLDQDGKLGGPGDAYGFGHYPGQYGMVLLSRFPIAHDRVRTFQKFLWKDMPEAKLPVQPSTGENYYSDEMLDVFRLSSKSFWDVPIRVACGGHSRTLHLLCSHPTPPVFDGPEDRNGLRNHDEIRLLADYIDPARSGYLLDDQGRRGGLPAGTAFVIVGDLNADPVDGDSPENIKQLLDHPLVNSGFVPCSSGGRRAAQARPDLNAHQRGAPRHDTADFSGGGQGNLRVDYVLPSCGLRVAGGGIFWPAADKPGGPAVATTDHRLVYIDLMLNAAEGETSSHQCQQ